MRTTLERELKLDADLGFELPDLGEPLEPRVFTSTYYDTEPRSLLRAGITLRRRVEHGLSRWQLKLPRDEARAEIEAPGGPAGPPEELRRLLVAHLRHGALVPVATLRTRRVGVRVGDGGRALADVTFDAVDVLEGQRQAGGFHELEIELLDGDAADLERLARALRRAGARRSDGLPKVMRVVGVGRDDGEAKPSALEQVRALLLRQLRELETHDPGVRLGDEPEDVHRFRVATRRTRALARVARPLVGEQLAGLAGELKWLAGLLGPVRDLDVLIVDVSRGVATLGDDRAGGEALVAGLEEQRESARDRLLEGLSSTRYLTLLDLFEATVGELRGDGGADLGPLAAGALRKLRKQARRLPATPPDAQIHELRKTAKRARYAAELAGGGEPRLRKLVDALKRVQDVSGEHQDAVVAEEALRARARGRMAVAAGRLIEREQMRRGEAREQLPDAVDRALELGRKRL